ncbi:unnamed protein product [Lepeophtheirus salmonis]|uniref:(salmon louse) hypothetical protein n=1 Tax=Lepeophtheirus salmonis TaxID=72036 RepID=A0A7R8CHZ9_LEPSM|nr:unnamed protein product [Lepeophtheirus salmonis]CAF2828180.1 unnamed protein product [Lepeophtheirus salmonis]
MFDILISILSVIGLSINLISIFILCKKKEQHYFHHFLKILAFYDSIAVTCCGLSYGFRTTWVPFGIKVYPFIAPYIVPLNHIAIVSSIYYIPSNLFIEKEIRKKFSEDQVQRLETIGKACTRSFSNYSFMKNVSVKFKDQWTIEPTELRKNSLYYTMYYVHLNALFGSVIPLIGLLYFNIHTVISLLKMIRRNSSISQSPNTIYLKEEATSLNPSVIEVVADLGRVSRHSSLKSYKRSFCRQFLHPRFIYSSRDSIIQKERRLTIISLCVISIFILCHIWKVIPTIVEASYSTDGLDHSNWPKWVLTIEKISHTMISLNSVINFLLYIIL